MDIKDIQIIQEQDFDSNDFDSEDILSSENLEDLILTLVITENAKNIDINIIHSKT